MCAASPVVLLLHRWVEVFMHRSMRGFILYAKEHGLSMPQIGALFHIHRQGAAGVSDLGLDLGITSAAASQMLERLVQQGLAFRSEDPHDRRVRQITLTEKGLRVLHESLRARQGWLDDLAGRLTPGEQEQVVTTLKILIEKTTQLETDPLRTNFQE